MPDLIKTLIENFQYKNEVTTAINQDNKLKFYIEPYLEPPTNNPYYYDFKTKIKNIYVDTYKLDRFLLYCQFPLKSVDLLETCFNDLARVWDSRNTVFNYQFKDENISNDAILYLNSLSNKFLENLWKSYKTSISDIVVIDLPTNQTTERPKPYPVFIKPASVRAFKIDSHPEDINEFEYIIFEQKKILQTDSGPKIASYLYYYTSEFYSVYKKDDSGGYIAIVEPVYHKLGYCPAFKISQNRLTDSAVYVGRSPITSVLAKLFWFVYENSEFTNHKGKYLAPFLQAIESSCGYKKSDGSIECKNGYLYNTKTKSLRRINKDVELCPDCGHKYHPGAGNKITVPKDFFSFANDSKVKIDAKMIQFITPEIKGTEFLQKDLYEQKLDIQQSISGKIEVTTKEAINEKQVASNYENPGQILISLANDLSVVIKKVYTTIFKLRYLEGFDRLNFHLGTEYFIFTESELQAREEATKNPIEKTEIRTQRLETKYKNNPAKLKRQLLLNRLLPYSNISDEDFSELFKTQKIEETVFSFRANFDNLISLFEAKFGNIVNFYENYFYENVSDFNKIKSIKSELNTLLNDLK